MTDDWNGDDVDGSRGERMNTDVPTALYFVQSFLVSEIRTDAFLYAM